MPQRAIVPARTLDPCPGEPMRLEPIRLAAFLSALALSGAAARAEAPEPGRWSLAFGDDERRPHTGVGAPPELASPEPPPGAGAPGARYAAAQQLASEGATTTARALLLGVAADPDAPPMLQRNSLHLAARLALAAGEAASAAETYASALALARSPQGASALVDVLDLGLGRALALAGRPLEAEEALARVEEERLSPHREAALLLRAQLAAERGDRALARERFERFVDRYPQSPSARDAKVALASFAVAEGHGEDARKTLRAIVREAPASAAGREAVRLLAAVAGASAAAGAVDLGEVEHLLEERRYDEAAALAGKARDAAAAAGDRDRERRAVAALLTAAWESLRFDDALEAHGWLVARRARGLDEYRLARLHAYRGDFAAAQRVVAAQSGGPKTRAFSARWAELNFEFGRYREAHRAWQAARKGVKRGGEEDPTDRMAWCLLRMGEARRAAKAFGERGGKSRGAGRLFERYWYGRALALAGDEAAARTVFAGLAADAPWEYYGVQAASRLAELDGDVPAQARRGAPQGSVRWSDAALEGAFAEAAAPASPGEVARALAALVEGFGDVAPEARRAAEHAALGDIEAARDELRVIDADLRALGAGASLAQRARADLLDNRATKRARSGATLRESRKDKGAAKAFAKQASALRRALRAAQRALGDPHALRRSVFERDGLADDPSDPSWREAYPLAWPDIVRPLAEQFAVPPYFVYAVMTVESAFHPHAVSVANAYGLLQMIPKTGRRVASELGYAEFSPERLLDPPTNLYFGTYYLSRAYAKFAGQEPLAAAAYNAGPHRVAAWLRARGEGPMDMFIEEIPYDQARNYAKSVLKHLARYRAAYHGELRTYVSNGIVRDFAPEPNY